MLVCLGAGGLHHDVVRFHHHTQAIQGGVAAQIVTGIGFLGAGVILHGRRWSLA